MASLAHLRDFGHQGMSEALSSGSTAPTGKRGAAGKIAPYESHAHKVPTPIKIR